MLCLWKLLHSYSDLQKALAIESTTSKGVFLLGLRLKTFGIFDICPLKFDHEERNWCPFLLDFFVIMCE